MASQSATAFSGNMKLLGKCCWTLKALAGLRRIHLEGLRWRVFDAEGQVGRIASQITTVVQGKDKPTYKAKDVCFTGRKLTDKVYYWHTGFNKENHNPRRFTCVAVDEYHCPDDRDRILRIFTRSEHPVGDRPLEPYVMPPRKVREMRPCSRCAMIRAQKKAEQQQHGTDDSKRHKKKEGNTKEAA